MNKPETKTCENCGSLGVSLAGTVYSCQKNERLVTEKTTPACPEWEPTIPTEGE